LLAYRRNVRLVPGVLPWIAFVLWVIPTVLMVDTAGHLLVYGFVFAQYVSIAVVLVYVVNARSITPRRLMDSLTAMWLSFIAAGYLGLIWPEGQITTTFGSLLPSGIRGDEYIQELVFPRFAEIQNPWGAEEPFVRPCAPFSYANGWGAGVALLLPVVIAGVIYTRSVTRASVVLLGGIGAVAPAAAASNRGMIVTMICVVVIVAMRQAVRGRWAAIIAILCAAGVMVVMLGTAGYFSGIGGRQDTVDTTEGRYDLYLETLQKTLKSPLLGYGTPRQSTSADVVVGSQGAIWAAMFCFGFVGLALFLLFLVGVTVRTWRAPTSVTLWLSGATIGMVVMAAFYGLDRHLAPYTAIAALLLRERYDPDSTFWPHRHGRQTATVDASAATEPPEPDGGVR
jgi:polysaccharide biosynthesis protein PslJ